MTVCITLDSARRGLMMINDDDKDESKRLTPTGSMVESLPGSCRRHRRQECPECGISQHVPVCSYFHHTCHFLAPIRVITGRQKKKTTIMTADEILTNFLATYVENQSPKIAKSGLSHVLDGYFFFKFKRLDLDYK